MFLIVLDTPVGKSHDVFGINLYGKHTADCAIDVVHPVTQPLISSTHTTLSTLRAAADQVVPLDDDPEFFPGNCCERVLKQEQQEIRDVLLAIADELEAQ